MSPARQELQSWLFGTQETQAAPKVEIGPFSLDLPALSQKIAGNLFGEKPVLTTETVQEFAPDPVANFSPDPEIKETDPFTTIYLPDYSGEGTIVETTGEVTPDYFADYSGEQDGNGKEFAPVGAPAPAPVKGSEATVKEILTEALTFTGEPAVLAQKWEAKLDELELPVTTEKPELEPVPHFKGKPEAQVQPLTPNPTIIPNQFGFEGEPIKPEGLTVDPQVIGFQVTNTEKRPVHLKEATPVKIDLPQTLKTVLTQVVNESPQAELKAVVQEKVMATANDQLLARGPEAATTAKVIAAVEEFSKGTPKSGTLELGAVDAPESAEQTVAIKPQTKAETEFSDKPAEERTMDFDSEDSNVLLKRGETTVIQPKSVEATDAEVKSEAKAESSVRTGLTEAAERVTDFIRARRPGSVTVSLNPEDLGSITVKVAIQGQKIDLDVNATDDRVRHAMTAQRGEFIQQLDTKGMSLGEFRMGSDAQSQTTDQGQQQNQPEAQREDFQRAVNLRLSQGAATNRPMATSSYGGRSVGIDTKA
ncbi:MAG: flagellar hook-length control protein FliK [Fimbriimonadaceae bacterium]